MASIGQITRPYFDILSISASQSSLRCGFRPLRRHYLGNSTTFGNGKVHVNYLKSLKLFLNNAQNAVHLIPPLNPSLSQFFEAIGSNRIYIFISAYSLSVIYNPLPVVHFFPANYKSRNNHTTRHP